MQGVQKSFSKYKVSDKSTPWVKCQWKIHPSGAVWKLRREISNIWRHWMKGIENWDKWKNLDKIDNLEGNLQYLMASDERTFFPSAYSKCWKDKNRKFLNYLLPAIDAISFKNTCFVSKDYSLQGKCWWQWWRQWG